jgi:hypothetical protein
MIRKRRDYRGVFFRGRPLRSAIRLVECPTAWSQDSDEPVIEAIGFNDPYEYRDA